MQAAARPRRAAGTREQTRPALTRHRGRAGLPQLLAAVWKSGDFLKQRAGAESLSGRLCWVAAGSLHQPQPVPPCAGQPPREARRLAQIRGCKSAGFLSRESSITLIYTCCRFGPFNPIKTPEEVQRGRM